VKEASCLLSIPNSYGEEEANKVLEALPLLTSAIKGILHSPRGNSPLMCAIGDSPPLL